MVSNGTWGRSPGLPQPVPCRARDALVMRARTYAQPERDGRVRARARRGPAAPCSLREPMLSAETGHFTRNDPKGLGLDASGPYERHAQPPPLS